MCSRVTCGRCGKPSWSGCGAHVEAVLRDVPPAQRCKCPEGAEVPSLLDGLWKMLRPPPKGR
jgi:hypothetical protein